MLIRKNVVERMHETVFSEVLSCGLGAEAVALILTCECLLSILFIAIVTASKPLLMH